MRIPFIGGPEDGREADYLNPPPALEMPVPSDLPLSPGEVSAPVYRLERYELQRATRFRLIYKYVYRNKS